MHLTADIQIKTERLLLRTVSVGDVQCVQQNWHLDEGPISTEEALSQIKRMADNHQANTEGTFKHLCLAMLMKDNMQFVGWCGLDNEGRSAINPAIFYLLKKACWGKGLATEAAKALLSYSFRDAGIPRVHGGCAFDNPASKRVMEKIGMVYKGLEEDGGYAFEITREGYLENR